METKTESQAEPPTPEPPKPTIKFYKKELVSNRLSLPNGRAVAFERIDGTDSGVLSTADEGLSAELDKAAAAGRGGVIVITEEQYQELKKNPAVGRSQIRSLNAQSLKQLLSSNQNRANENQVVAPKQEQSAPMEVPRGLATVSSRRKLQELTERAKAPAVVA